MLLQHEHSLLILTIKLITVSSHLPTTSIKVFYGALMLVRRRHSGAALNFHDWVATTVGKEGKVIVIS